MSVQSISNNATNSGFSGIADLFFSPITKIALNTFQIMGLTAPSSSDGIAISKPLPEFMNPKFWAARRNESLFDGVTRVAKSADQPLPDSSGIQGYMKVATTRNFALKVLDYKIQDLLGQTLGKGSEGSGDQNKKTDPIVQDCFSASECPDIDETKVHDRAQKAAKVIGSKRQGIVEWIKNGFSPPEWQNVQEVLRFRSDDPREKFLFISAEPDHNGALNPSLISGILSKLSNKFDLKFQVLKRHQDICKAIESGAKTGNLAYVIISGHGNPWEIEFETGTFFKDGRKKEFAINKLSEASEFSRCFSGVNPNGKIILLSCSTGGRKTVGTEENPKESDYLFDNIAQKMSDGAKRTVLAPIHDAAPVLVRFLSEDDVTLYHPESLLYSFNPFYNSNLFTAFRPHFKDCSSKPGMENLHKRELMATETIKTDLIARSLLHKDDILDNSEYLQFCKDDPRKKVLFLSAENDGGQALEPKQNSKILSLFADRFDLKYKVVGSFKQICQEVDQARKAGDLVTLVIQGYGTPEGMLLSENRDGTKNRLAISDNFSKCFSAIPKDGTIVLMGSSLGQNGENKENIAQKIADESKRTVLATTCPIYPSDTVVQSINPLLLYHPGYSYVFNSIFMGCPENSDNHFKTFFPADVGKDSQEL